MSTSRLLVCFLTLLLFSDFCVSVTEAQIIPAQPTVGTVQQAVAGAESAEAKEDVKWVSWPKVTMPKVTMPKLRVPDMGKLFSPVSSGFEKVTAGSKKAWEGTKEMFSFASKDEVPSKPYEPRQSLWQKLTTKNSEPTGPQTVGEFMSQPRLQH